MDRKATRATRPVDAWPALAANEDPSTAVNPFGRPPGGRGIRNRSTHRRCGTHQRPAGRPWRGRASWRGAGAGVQDRL